MTSPDRPNHYDALIIGARCAGAATAMLLARAGLKVLAIDRDSEGTDTMSTHALMRGAVMQLDRWGILETLALQNTPVVRKTSFQYADQALKLEIRPSFGVDVLLAPRRTVLDAQLVAAARAAGAEVRHRTALQELVRDVVSGRVTGAILSDPDGREFRVSADITVGADGRRSSLARKIGAKTLAETTTSTGCIYGYFEGLPDDGYQWYYNTSSAAGVIPTNQGAHCVFAAVSASEFRRIRQSQDTHNLLLTLAGRANASLGAQLADATCVSHPVIFAGANGHIRQSHGPGWALVGDAGYFKDPLSAHGITDALRDAEILANAVIAGRDGALAGYQTCRDALSRDLFWITDRIASFDWTLPELQTLHKALNNAMKNEQIWMAHAFKRQQTAA